MVAVTYFVDWSAVASYARFCLYAIALVGFVLVTPLIVAALTPVIVGCCSALPQVAIVVAIFAAAVKLFQWGG